MTLRHHLETRLQNAMQQAGVPMPCNPMLAPSKNPQFGDYQANGAMAAAKALGKNPRELAAEIVQHLQLEDTASQVDIAGPGFINIHLKPEWLAATLSQNTPSLAPVNAQPDTIIVDYSGPNLAKEMHVGHLRSSILGDALVNVLEHLGHQVIRQNHVGDWGTQFGMLIAELEACTQSGHSAELALNDLEHFYKQAKKHFDESPEFAQQARDYVVQLQSGNPQMLKLWQQFRDLSLKHSDAIYQQLEVGLNRSHIRGESAYNEDLPQLVAELQQQGLSSCDEGAQVVFLSELADKKGNPSPVIVQKKDGGYLYATTDLAALRYRAQQLKAQRIIYFIDARQSLHLQQVFTLAKKAGWVAPSVRLEHMAFGTMLGEDNKPFKTRSGDTVKLASLLAEAKTRAAETLRQKNPQLSDAEVDHIAQAVGIGAVKYADLSKTRTLDYVFSWEAMLSLEGNTGPYLQYAYARICSLFRRAEISHSLQATPIIIQAPQERALALKLLQFQDVLEQIAQDGLLHSLCTYLYDLSSLFMTFYEACPILKDGTPDPLKNSRLHLSQQVASSLKTGLGLLGIRVLEQM